jgi:1-acyl-sn-glycerol-3-phosphate acyltransferase
MILFRSLVYFFFFIIATLVCAIPMFTIGWFLSPVNVGRFGNAWGKINLWLLKYLCGLDYTITGQENLPEKNAIILAKHQSTWETISLRGLLPPNQAWVLKRELLRVPFFGWALMAARAISIDRSSGRKAMKQVIEEGTRRLNSGEWVVIFPEGTRTAPGERRKYGAGGALLAEKSGYPIVPVAHNAGVFWRRRDIRKYPGTIQVVIGPLIETEGLTANEINKRVEEWIETTVASLPQTSE